jgi:hypothetical protein
MISLLEGFHLGGIGVSVDEDKGKAKEQTI